MKSVVRLVVFCGLSMGVFSCKKAVDCETPLIRKAVFYSPVSSLTVPDTSYDLVKYRQESGFTQISEIYPGTRLTKEGTNKSLYFPENGSITYDYNWSITLHPSGKVFLLSKIKHENSSSKTHHCTNTVTYTINQYGVDSAVTVDGNPYSATPYYPADFQIAYY